MTLRLSEVLAAMSAALDLTEGQPTGHSARTAVIGMAIGDAVGLGRADQAALLHASLLKDAGCSATAARVASLFAADDLVVKSQRRYIDHVSKRASLGLALRYAAPDAGPVTRGRQVVRAVRHGFRLQDETVLLRCERGADIARLIGLGPVVADAISALDELWNGRGRPRGLRGDAIPLLARIMGLAQTVELFASRNGPEAALDIARLRRGTWFDPELVDALAAIEYDRGVLAACGDTTLEDVLAAADHAEEIVPADQERLDRVAEAFATIIDAKSPYTAEHSTGVARIADGIAERMGFEPDERRRLRRAALLHDIGKLGVPNTILDKPGRLSDGEMALMRRHTAWTAEILGRVSAFSSLAADAAAHHERLDGSGYHLGLTGDQLSRTARVLAVADVAEALTADRPYRTAMPEERVEAILRADAAVGLCPDAVEALLDGMHEGAVALAA